MGEDKETEIDRPVSEVSQTSRLWAAKARLGIYLQASGLLNHRPGWDDLGRDIGREEVRTED